MSVQKSLSQIYDTEISELEKVLFSTQDAVYAVLVNNAQLIEDSKKLPSGLWMLVIGVLSIVVAFVGFAASEIGWGQPNAEQLMSQAVEGDLPEIIYTNDYRNCGATSNSGGCFNPSTPDVIYLSPNMRYTVFKYTLLHELAHHQQFHNKETVAECAADEQAKLWGADISGSSYTTMCGN